MRIDPHEWTWRHSPCSAKSLMPWETRQFSLCRAGPHRNALEHKDPCRDICGNSKNQDTISDNASIPKCKDPLNLKLSLFLRSSKFYERRIGHHGCLNIECAGKESFVGAFGVKTTSYQCLSLPRNNLANWTSIWALVLLIEFQNHIHQKWAIMSMAWLEYYTARRLWLRAPFNSMHQAAWLNPIYSVQLECASCCGADLWCTAQFIMLRGEVLGKFYPSQKLLSKLAPNHHQNKFRTSDVFK